MRIAIFLPNWVGDVVMATPAVYALRERYPAAHLIAVVRPYVAGVLDGSYWFNEYLSLDPREFVDAFEQIGISVEFRYRCWIADEFGRAERLRVFQCHFA